MMFTASGRIKRFLSFNYNTNLATVGFVYILRMVFQPDRSIHRVNNFYYLCSPLKSYFNFTLNHITVGFVDSPKDSPAASQTDLSAGGMLQKSSDGGGHGMQTTVTRTVTRTSGGRVLEETTNTQSSNNMQVWLNDFRQQQKMVLSL